MSEINKKNLVNRGGFNKTKKCCLKKKARNKRGNYKKTMGKRRSRKGGAFFPDNDIVKIKYNDNTEDPEKFIKCPICGKDEFQRRNATLDKSKLQQGLFDFITGTDGSVLNDISIYAYFCNECGYTIMIRDPKEKTENIYKNLVVANKENSFF